MPFCTFIEDFALDVTHRSAFAMEVGERSVTAIIVPKGGLQVRFSHIVRRAFPHAKVVRMPSPNRFETKEVFEVVSEDTEMEPRLRAFLTSLRGCITIDDGLDESHALAPHSVLSDDGWNRTYVGNLVNRAKDYYSNYSYRDRDAASEICERVLEFFRWHPRYSDAGAVAPAPSSNPDVEENLPRVIASVVSEELGKRLLIPRRLEEIPPQKDYDEAESGISREKLQEGTVGLDYWLSGVIVVIDDLYESGGTLMEVGRACRNAGANAVLGLAITKNAKKTQGMGVDTWPWG